MNKLLCINTKKLTAVCLCIFLIVVMNPPVLRKLPIETLPHYFLILALGYLAAMIYKDKALVFNKQRYLLCCLILFLIIQFTLPVGRHPFYIKLFLSYIPLLFLVFFDNEVYNYTFFYFRKTMLFFAVCSIGLFILLLLFSQDGLPLPYFELDPVSAAHKNRGLVYHIYGFMLTYPTILIDIQGVTIWRTTGPFTEPGHFGIHLGLLIAGELVLLKKRSPLLVICGCLTFSTAFYVILILTELYNIFCNKKFNWKIYLPIVVISVFFLLWIDKELLEILWNLAIGRNMEADDILDNRTNPSALFVFSMFLKSSFSDWFFGYGTYALEQRGVVVSDYREFFYDSGILGLMLTTSTFLVILIRANIKYLLLFISILVMIFLHRTWMFWYPYLYVITLLILGSNDRNKPDVKYSN